MQYRVNGFHCFGESESIRVGTGFGDNFKGSQELLREFFGGVCGPEVFRFDENLTSDRELQCWSSFEIRMVLVAFLGLGHVFLEETMEVIEVHCEISGAVVMRMSQERDGVRPRER